MRKQSRRPASEWEELVKCYDQGDQNITDFCQEHCINKHSFNYWRAKQRTSSSPGFISLHPTSSSSGAILVRCSGGIELELPGDYPPANLLQLIRGLSC